MQRLIAVAALGIVCDPSHAQVTIRATGPLSPSLERKVARTAEPTLLPRSRFPGASKLTGDRIATVLCGQSTDVYWRELSNLNGETAPPRKSRVGDAAFSTKWPACAYVTASPVTYIVRPNDNAWSVFRNLTGSAIDDIGLRRFFAGSKVANIREVHAGDVLVGTHYTLPTQIRASQAGLSDLLSSGAGPDNGPIRRSGDGTRPAKLILAAGRVASGALEPPAECAGGPAPPFADAPRMKAIYEWSRGRLEERGLNRSPAEVWVFDNGFAGGSLNADGEPVFGTGFPPRMFMRGFDGIIGPSVANGTIRPWYAQKDTPDPLAGHGTHVAGLVLGGPSMTSVLPVFDDGQASILKLVSVNIGKGSDTLVAGSAGEIRRLVALGPFRIINLSIEYQDDPLEPVKSDFDIMVEDQTRLFIVAAGNDGDDVSNGILPAAYGGPGRVNLITVAATLPDGSLAAFSNKGAAVDIAAPGCGVVSWIDAQGTTSALSGTSQATPLVSWTAAALRTLGGPGARRIKQRIFTSGDLLATPSGADAVDRAPAMIASRSRLNPEKALLVYDDVVTVRDAAGVARTWLGDVNALSGVRCPGSRPGLKDIWSAKREGSTMWIFAGRVGGTLSSPCGGSADPQGTIRFRKRAELTATGPTRVTPSIENVSLDRLDEVVFANAPTSAE